MNNRFTARRWNLAFGPSFTFGQSIVHNNIKRLSEKEILAFKMTQFSVNSFLCGKCNYSIQLTIVVFLVALSQMLLAQNPALPHLGKDPLDKVIGAMTLDEKIRIVVGPAKMPAAPPHAAPGTPVKPPLPANVDFLTYFSKGKVSGSAGESFAIPRLGIPSVVFADGPAGVRIDPVRNKDTTHHFYATAFPIATLLASSWDTALVRQVGRVMGSEVHAYGVDVLLAPGMNIHRNPLTGRNFEYYSEDPLVAGYMAAYMVKGIQSNGVGTSIKHFAVNNQETNRNGVDARLSERALREIYLRGFEIAVKQGKPWTVMSSYNKINGTYASESQDLLTSVLRKEWGYKGFVMTDWWAEHDPVAQMKAGNDLLMPGTPSQIKEIKEAIENGKLDIEIIDQNVKRILNITLRSPVFNHYPYNNNPDLKGNAALVRQAASEGMVLLKNANITLPLLKNRDRVAAFGNTSYNIIVGGTGSGYVNKAYKVSLVSGLVNAGFKINNELNQSYQDYIATQKAKLPPETFWRLPQIAEMPVNKGLIENMVKESDVAVITIGRNSGEGEDRKLDGDFTLTPAERGLIETVSQVYHAVNKKVVVVLNIGGVIETASWRDFADAILLAWQPGQEAGNSIADVLSGAVNPSGKLATTFPLNYTDVPSASNFPGTNTAPAEVKYDEGIYIGYRYYNTRKVIPAYNFGFGLSYTQFAYSNLKLSSHQFQQGFIVQVTVTNTGKTAGKEVVELYLSAPANKEDKPESELKAFAKTRLLQPGEAQVVQFKLAPGSLASYYTAVSAWVADGGTYTVKIGASSTDIRQTAQFTLPKDIVVEKVVPGLFSQRK